MQQKGCNDNKKDKKKVYLETENNVKETETVTTNNNILETEVSKEKYVKYVPKIHKRKSII